MHVRNVACAWFIGYTVTVAPVYPALEVHFTHELSYTDVPATTYPLYNSLPTVAQGTAYMPTWMSGRLNLNPIMPSSDPF